MHRIKITKVQFYLLIIFLNLILQAISYIILKIEHNETFAIAFEIFVGLVGNGLLVYINSEEQNIASFYFKNILHKLQTFDKPFFVLMITVVNALVQLVSSILPVYIKNQVEVSAISLFLSIVGTAIVTYLSTEESKAPE